MRVSFGVTNKLGRISKFICLFKKISDRLSEIPQNQLEDSVKNFLEALGKIDRPFLTTLEDKILTVIETENGRIKNEND